MWTNRPHSKVLFKLYGSVINPRLTGVSSPDIPLGAPPQPEKDKVITETIVALRTGDWGAIPQASLSQIAWEEGKKSFVFDEYKNRDLTLTGLSEKQLRECSMLHGTYLDYSYHGLVASSVNLPPEVIQIAWKWKHETPFTDDGEEYLRILSDKNMGFAAVPRTWVFNTINKYVNSSSLEQVHSPSPYLRANACTLWMMPKVHKQRTPTPGRAIVQGYAWMEATSKTLGHLAYLFLFHLDRTDGFTYKDFRPSDEMDALLNTTLTIQSANTQQFIQEYDVDACYPSIDERDVTESLHYLNTNLGNLDTRQFYHNIVPRMKYLLHNYFISDHLGRVWRQVKGLPQGAAAAPALADLTLFAKQLTLHKEFQKLFRRPLFQQRYLDDLLIVDDIDIPEDLIKHHFRPFTLSRVHESQNPGMHTFLGWDIDALGNHRVHYKPTWVNRFAPLYGGLKTQHLIAYFIAQVIRIGVFTSTQEWFDEDLKRWIDSLPTRGWPAELTKELLIYFREVHEVHTNNYHHVFHRYRTWLQQPQTYRRDNTDKSPFKDLWSVCFKTTGEGYFGENPELPIDDAFALLPYLQGDKYKIDTVGTWNEVKQLRPGIEKHFKRGIGAPYRGTRSNTALATKTFKYYPRNWKRYERTLLEEPSYETLIKACEDPTYLEPTETWLEYFDESPSYSQLWPWQSRKEESNKWRKTQDDQHFNF